MRRGREARLGRELTRRRRTKAREDLALRYQLRDLAQLISRAKGVRGCGRQTSWQTGADTPGVPRNTIELVIERIGEELRAHFRGLVKCKNPWQCAICALALQVERGKLVQQLNDRHVAAGGLMDLGTFTLPHDLGDPLEPMRKKVSSAWQYVISGAPWQRWKESLGLVGQVRAHEITEGEHGWHPHIHVAFYYARPITDEQRAAFRAWLEGRWRAAVVRPDKRGRRWRAPSSRHGVTLEPLRRTDYLTKMGLARELVMAHTKVGHEGHRTPFQVLRDLLATNDSLEKAAGLKLWREWARGMRGARQLTTSRGLMQRYELPQLSDRQLFLEERGQLAAAETVVWFTTEEWAEILRLGPIVRVQLLRCVDVPDVDRAGYILAVLDRAAGLEPLPF